MTQRAVIGRVRRAVGPGSAGVAARVLFPLDHLYQRAGVPVPAAVVAHPDHIPAPFRALLVHDGSMTAALEQHWGPVALRVLSVATEGASFFRRVLLVQEYNARPVVMGAIHIDLDAFAPSVRRQIVQNRVPFGRILSEAGIDYRSRPTTFFFVLPNSEMMGVFWMREPRALFGRQTELLVHRQKVGDVVEILPA